jgi:hypothetical protein
VTTRLRRECGVGIADRFTCVQAGAEHYRVSWPVAHRAYVAHVGELLAEPLPPVCVLGIDETRRGKIRWVQDPVSGRWTVAHDRWHTAVVDVAGTGGLLAHIDGRTAARVAEWLLAQPDPWRAGVSHVTIDLSASYLRAVSDALPDAVVVADRFHLVRLANDMLTEVRQRATREARGRRGRRGPEWAGRRRLLTAHERLTPEAFAKPWNSLIDAGDPGIEILHAYTVKREPATAARPGRHPPGPGGHLAPAVAVLRPGRVLPLTGGAPSRRHHRNLVARGRGRPHHRALQRPLRGLQPSRETPGTQRLRIPQRQQPAPTHTVGMHSSTPTSLSCDQREARSNSISQKRSGCPASPT